MKEFIVNVKIRPLTPIWTGDENRRGKNLRETGIIGSLRWWYEALVRGLGGKACDPTGDERCRLDQEKFKKSLKSGLSTQEALSQQICPVCQLFGCTGWSRKFVLRTETLRSSYAPFVIAKPKGSQKPTFLGYYDRTGNHYEKNGGLMGEYKLTFIAENDKLNLIKLLLKLATEWGLGAGIQKGFGIVHVEEDLKLSNVNLHEIQNKPQETNYKLPLPRIDQFFFCKIPLKNGVIEDIKKVVGQNIFETMDDLRVRSPLNGNTFSALPYIPTSPWIRQAIRKLFKNNDVLRHFIMGFVSVKGNPKPIHLDCWKHSIESDKNNRNKYYCKECKKGNIEEKDILEKTGSKIFVSHLYNENFFVDKKPVWLMKIWGWIPAIPDGIGVSREEVLKIIQENIKKEDFWKDAFDLSKNPVDIDNIFEKWNVGPLEILENGGVLYE
jgi:CRISPR-associated protein Cmr1